MQGELHRWYENCEMRTIVLSDDSGDGSLDPLWFPGGNQLQREGAIRRNLTVGQTLGCMWAICIHVVQPP